MRTETHAGELGIELQSLEEHAALDLAVDGADEVSPSLELIKGLGGALLREKMVVQAARRFVVIVDESKRVARLGTRAPVPVEVAPFSWRAHLPFFKRLGATPALRTDAGEPYVTDNGNLIVDLHFEAGIEDAVQLEEALRSRAGVVETGLFLGVADEAHVAAASGVDVMRRSQA